MKSEIKKKFVDHGFGFPVILIDVPVDKVRGVLIPDINQKVYREAVLKVLARKPARLSGDEIKFIRHCFQMTTKMFGKRFGDVSHAAVLKWEKSAKRPTDMNWSTEKDIRLSMLKFLDETPKVLAMLYDELEEVASRDSKPIQIEAKQVAYI